MRKRPLADRFWAKVDKSGELAGNAKLTNAQVAEIRRLYKWRTPGRSTVDLAKQFGVCNQTISEIVRGTRYTR